MKTNYPYALKTTLVYEGGYANNPADPGGDTMKGVTAAVFNAYLAKHGKDRRNVRTITDLELQDIYKSGYWDKINGDTLSPGVDLVVFDYAVNSGPSRATKDLYSSLGGTSVDTVKKVCSKRLAFLRGLKTWGTFGKGWGTRVANVEAKGLVLASGTPEKAAAVLSKEIATDTTKIVTKASVATAGATTTIAGPVVAVGSTDITTGGWISIVVIGAIVIAGTIWLVKSAIANGTRAAEFKKVADSLGEGDTHGL